MKRFHQARYFDSGDPDNPHPYYGPCDGFGPDETCAECTGMFGHDDGSVSTRDGKIVRRAPLPLRIKRAWSALRGVAAALR